MSAKSKIQWCDSTINWWEGCTKVSAGCAHCYAEARDRRMMTEPVIHWGPGAPRRKSQSAVKAALAINAKPWICDECGEAFARPTRHGDVQHLTWCASLKFHRRRVFSLSLADMWDREVLTAWRYEALKTIWRCRDCVWIICSKRWQEWIKCLTEMMKWNKNQGNSAFHAWLLDWSTGKAPVNIIGLCSVEDQQRANERIPQFLTVPLACRGLSLEPLIGPIKLKPEWLGGGNISWPVIGGESGPDARTCQVEWIRSLVQQGEAAGVPVFVKQCIAKCAFFADR